MNNKLITTIFAATALFATLSARADTHDCPSLTELRLNVGKYRLNLVDKRPICISLPGTFMINIKNPPGSGVSVGAGDVTAEEKVANGVTIDGDNQDDKEWLAVTVDGSAAPGDLIEFWINVEGIGKLDPKVRVVDSNLALTLTSTAFYEALNILGLTFEDAINLGPPPKEGE